MEREFPLIQINLPEIPGANALGIPFDASGRLNGAEGLTPPVIVTATLRALQTKAPTDAPSAMWVLDLEESQQAFADLKDIAPQVGLAHCYDDRGRGCWRRDNEVVSDPAAFALLWPHVASAVRSDLRCTPAEALVEIEAAFAQERARVEAERARRRKICLDDLMTAPAWRVIQALWWIGYRDPERVLDAPEYEADAPNEEADLLLDFAMAIDAKHQPQDGKSKSLLLHAASRAPGLLLGVPSGSTSLEPIDHRLISSQFRLGNDDARSGDLVWRSVRIDRVKLFEVFRPAGGALDDCPIHKKTSWLIGKLGSSAAPLSASLARMLAKEWLSKDGSQPSPEAIEEEKDRLQALRRSFNRKPKPTGAK